VHDHFSKHSAGARLGQTAAGDGYAHTSSGLQVQERETTLRITEQEAAVISPRHARYSMTTRHDAMLPTTPVKCISLIP